MSSVTPPDSGQALPASPLARGMRLLQCFTTEDYELSAKDLVLKSGLARPTAFRLIANLCEVGLLHYSERRRKYMIGSVLLTMSASFLASMTIRAIARPLMLEFAEIAEGQVSLSVNTDDHRLIYAEIIQDRKNTVFCPDPGTAVSRSRTASGRAYLVSLPEDIYSMQIQSILAKGDISAQWLDSALDATRKDLAHLGYCRNLGDLKQSIVSIAVPVNAHHGDRRFVFGATIPAYRLKETPELLDQLGMRLATLVHNVQVAIRADKVP